MLHAYMISSHWFQVLLIDREGNERMETIQTYGDRFCNVCESVRQSYPGWAILESWEVCQPLAPEQVAA